MEECQWPPLAEPYATALRETVAFVFTRTEPVGIVATGTIVRGNPSPSSDIDLYVVHRQPWRQRFQRFFAGVPAEIFVNPVERVREYFAEERGLGRPVTSHMLATGFVVLRRDPVVDGLVDDAARDLADPPRLDERELRRAAYFAAAQLEDALDIAEVDEQNCALLLARAVDAAIAHRFRRAGRWLPRHKELLAALAEVDPALVDEARAFYRAASFSERLARARAIVGSAVGETGFFEWDTEPG